MSAALAGRLCLVSSILASLTISGASVTVEARDPRSSVSQSAVRQETPTGKVITPTAAGGAFLQDLDPKHSNAPDVRADGPASIAVSPDGKVLAILAGGYNSFADREGKFPPELATEYLFLFDITGPHPIQLRVFPVRSSFQGLAWMPSSNRVFASGGVDDKVDEFVRSGTAFVPGRTFALGHKSWVGPDPKDLPPGSTNGTRGEVAGLAVSPDGTRLLVGNMVNESVTLIGIASGQIVTEQDLRPGVIDPTRSGVPGGSYPRAVVWTSPTRAYVVSERDRELISLTVSTHKIRVLHRIPVRGQPVAVLANRSGSRIYVALDTTSHVAVFDTARDKLIETIDPVAPQRMYSNARMLGGANTNALALTPDQRTLLVSNGGQNSIAVVRLSDIARGLPVTTRKASDPDHDETALEHSQVVGLVPTGWYPSGVATSKDGAIWYVVNGKNPTGPNISWCHEIDPVRNTCIPIQNDSGLLTSVNQHLEQLEKASLLSLPAPAPAELARLTKQVARNNRFDTPDKTAADDRLFAFLHEHIKHVIYILKENRSYDQVLGDLGVGNGDPRFTLFPEKISPNHHAIARNFVDLDNTLVSGEGSPQGQTWTYAAQDNDYNERNEPHVYVGRGVREGYGNNRLMNMGLATNQERHAESSVSPTDPNILPGARDMNAPDGPNGEEGKGYIWDAALRKGLTIRNWGLSPSPIFYYRASWSLVHDPYSQHQRVFWTSRASLMPYSDPYYYSFNPALPDFWRLKEWKREFDQFVAAGSAPNLMVMWLSGDHFGDFERALDGVNTPETQMADNDYALGLLIQTVANSPFAKDTLIVSIEDDAWDGPDHVDSHRTVALIAGPYVRQHVVVSTRYTTVSLVKTIEEVLGIGPIGLNDALAAPMSDVFDPNAASWNYKAIVPDVLRSTKLPLPPDDHAGVVFPKHLAAYWVKAMAGQDFSGPDCINPETFSRALWQGLRDRYPGASTGTGSVKKPGLGTQRAGAPSR